MVLSCEMESSDARKYSFDAMMWRCRQQDEDTVKEEVHVFGNAKSSGDRQMPGYSLNRNEAKSHQRLQHSASIQVSCKANQRFACN